MLTHSESDRAIVEAQLGRSVRGNWSVARRCHLGLPMAIESHPRLEDGSPFPTLYWLTCPLLAKRVSRLESEGLMSAMNERLPRDDRMRSRLADAIARYRSRRNEHEVIEDSGSPPGGGPDKIKCLHAHVAHELVDGRNPIGGIALASAGFPDCREGCVIAG